MTFNLGAGEVDTRPDEFGLCTVDRDYGFAKVTCHFLVNFDIYSAIVFHQVASFRLTDIF